MNSRLSSLLRKSTVALWHRLPAGVSTGWKPVAHILQRSVRVILAQALACSVIVAGCGGERGTRQAGRDQGESVVRTANCGPVELTVTANKHEFTLAERVRLTVEVLAEEATDVDLPWLGESFSAGSIHDHRECPTEVANGKRRRRQEYILDVFLAGEFAIPAVAARFTDRQTNVEGAVTTEEFSVTVKSLEAGELECSTLRDIKGPVALSATRAWGPWVGGGLGGAMAVALVITWSLRRRRAQAREVILPPHEWALGQLRLLTEQRLPKHGLVHEFYIQLSMIVRQYVARRFDLIAPLRTTQESMTEIQRSPTLPAEVHEVLGGFLRTCDLVKFAQHSPPADEIEAALTAARGFVERTAPKETREAAA